MPRSLSFGLILFTCMAGCGVGEPDDDLLQGVDVLGNKGHTLDSVIVEVLATEEDGLNRVMDLDFRGGRRAVDGQRQ